MDIFADMLPQVTVTIQMSVLGLSHVEQELAEKILSELG